VYDPIEREAHKRGHLVVHAKIQHTYHAKDNVIPTAAMMQPEIDEASCKTPASDLSSSRNCHDMASYLGL